MNEQAIGSINGSDEDEKNITSDDSSMDEAMVVDCDEDESEDTHVKSKERHQLRCDISLLANDESGECNNASSNSSSSNTAFNCSTPLNTSFSTCTSNPNGE